MDTHGHSVINKLVVGEGINKVMVRQALELMICSGFFEAMTQSFIHEDEYEMGEGVSLINTSGEMKGGGGRITIDHKREKGGGNES
jgi:hypothetical protein